MERHKRKTRKDNVFGVVLDLVDVVDVTFEKLTGKTFVDWLKECQQQPMELPPGEKTVSSPSVMPLADAYAVLGLSSTATLEEVKRRYRELARLFHPDAPGGYKEAMVLLNNAYERIRKGGK